MSRATGKPQIKAPHLPTGFIYDLPSLLPPPNSMPTINPAPIVYAITPRGSQSPIQSPDSSAELQVLNLQIEKQQLEIRLLELEAQSKVRSLSKVQHLHEVLSLLLPCTISCVSICHCRLHRLGQLFSRIPSYHQ